MSDGTLMSDGLRFVKVYRTSLPLATVRRNAFCQQERNRSRVKPVLNYLSAYIMIKIDRHNKYDYVDIA